ncbi:MAG: DUF3850 domain-containing protein [Clostridium celatum]|nr:DUF3850 domain-containing protein [Clostridium celatum]
MKIHELKILSRYYEDVAMSNKTFELRKDDRDYEVGDYLNLREIDNNEYTGREINVEIVYILRNCSEYGLKEGYVILGIQ